MDSAQQPRTAWNHFLLMNLAGKHQGPVPPNGRGPKSVPQDSVKGPILVVIYGINDNQTPLDR